MELMLLRPFWLLALLPWLWQGSRASSQSGRSSISSMMTLPSDTYSWGDSGSSLPVRRTGQRSRAGHTSSSQASARGQG